MLRAELGGVEIQRWGVNFVLALWPFKSDNSNDTKVQGELEEYTRSQHQKGRIANTRERRSRTGLNLGSEKCSMWRE